jgi:hypothetical protein
VSAVLVGHAARARACATADTVNKSARALHAADNVNKFARATADVVNRSSDQCVPHDNFLLNYNFCLHADLPAYLNDHQRLKI